MRNGSQNNHFSWQEGQTKAHSPSGEPLPVATREMVMRWLDFSPDAALVVDPAGTIVLLNEPAASLFGYPSDELVNQPLEELLPQHLHGAPGAQRTRYMHAPRARPMGTGLNLRGQRKNGSTFPVDISLRPFLLEQVPHVLGTIRDMTAQHQASQERARLTEQLQIQNYLINLSHDAILVRDPQGRILSWNRGAADLYGWKEQEALGQVSYLLLSTQFPRSRERFEQLLEQEGRWDGDLIHLCRDGQQVIVESRQVVMRDEQGLPTAILEINRDVTERRLLEQVEQEVRAEVKARLDVLQLILDRLPTGVFLVQGPDTRLILANRAATELWGAEWKVGQSMEDFTRQHHIHASDFGQHHRGAALLPQNTANRGRDIGGREVGGRDLVEQWLEQVVIAAINHRDLNGRMA
jgi:PAS domain S-box-containing protein